MSYSSCLPQRCCTLARALLFAAGAAGASQASAQVAQDVNQLPTINVTAQKRVEEVTTVPVSAMALDQDALDRRGVKDIADIARLVPGVTLQGSDDVGNINIAIRGIISTVGAATTGIYIDDVPVQIRQNSAEWGNPYPKIFDLDRVEVLRGPQGTLFGAGSEGGAVRFITPEASLVKTKGMAVADWALTSGGQPSYEEGASYSGPIVVGKLGVHASVWHREDGGYADRLDPATGAILAHDGNTAGSTVMHLGAKFAATPDLLISPALFYQRTINADMGLFAERAGTYKIYSRIAQPHDDRFLLSTLAADYDFGAFSFKSVSSYIDRKVDEEYDSTGYELSSLFVPYLPAGTPTPLSPLTGAISVPFDPNYLVAAHYHSKQRGVTQELRLTSNDAPGAPLSWVGGLFYQRSIAGYDPLYEDDQLDALANYDSILSGYGPANSATLFTKAPIDGRYSYVDHLVAVETDLAAFGNLSYALTPRLKLSGGLRVGRSGFSYTDAQDGPWGPSQGQPNRFAGSQAEVPVTPRANLSWQIDHDRMVYASAAKGYRIGGANAALPSCSADLATLGLSSTPPTYKSDSLWSYEVGAKGRLLDGKVLLESSAYWINWNDIQQSIYLQTCGYNFIGNLGRARSRGFDLQAEWAATRYLVLSSTAGLVDARYIETVVQDSSILAQSGDRLPTPAWTYTAGAEYRFAVRDRVEGYTRVDYEFNGSYPRSGSDNVFGSDPLTRMAPAVRLVNARLGAKFGGWDVALYGNNLTNASTSLFRSHTAAGIPDLRDARLHPLAVGVSAHLHF